MDTAAAVPSGGGADTLDPQDPAEPTARERFERLAQRRFAEIDHPQLGRLRVQSLTRNEFRDLRAWLAQGENEKYGWEALICCCLVDEAGSRIFRTGEALTLCEQWDGSLVDELGAAIENHVGFLRDRWNVEAVEEAVKN
jgi:hypothetical protein